jgi:signal transduction histidine kinase
VRGRRLRGRRLLPRSVRGRATAVVTLVTAAALSLCAAVLLYAVHSTLVGTARATADHQVTAAADQLRAGALTPQALQAASVGKITVTQLTPVAVGPVPGQGGASTGPAPGSAASPSTGTGTTAARASSLSVPTPEGTFLLQATPDLAAVNSVLSTITQLLLASIPLVLLLVAALTWAAMGRAMRPVEAIRAEFAEITTHDLHRRVPDPRSGDEVSRLADTMNTTLDQLQRAVARLRTFTSDASHELRSPLTTLRTRLELAVARPDRADWPDTGREALRDAEQLQEIVEDLLLLARLDTGQLHGRERVALTDLVRTVAGQRVRDRRLVVDDLAPHPARVLGSRVALARLLANLLDNAARHADSTVAVTLEAHEDLLTVAVSDDGPGIPEQDRERVFDRFTRLDGARTRDSAAGTAGTGLGLAIARDIATAHGGTLTAEAPTAGRPTGARLLLTLPTDDPAPGSARRRTGPRSAPVPARSPDPGTPARPHRR